MNFLVTPQAKIGVLVVDDSAFMRSALSGMINSDPGLFVVGTACNGAEALAKTPHLHPDVITLDVEMPGLNGLETLRCIKARFPTPVLIVSSASDTDANITFAALGAGAFDYVPKSLSPTSLDILHIRHDLISKLKAAANWQRTRGGIEKRKPPQSAPLEWKSFSTRPAIIAIGASTGGPRALEEILTQFPADLPVPVLIVQHMPLGFTKSFAERLDKMCSITVQETLNGKPFLPGVVYIAPAGIHTTVRRTSATAFYAHLTAEPNACQHIPSIDIIMQSVAGAFKSEAMGVILTGMGSDGALGMTAIHRAGGITIGQDESSCMVYSMPRACADLGILQRIVPLAQISAQILQATQCRKRA
ncbi:MAG TPA: chemotaxis response regulator protein-glutamate methylesterase [Candidatus Sulfotelmatobacter sp.]